MLAYACFGGMPAYLRHWVGKGGPAEQVQRTFLSPGRVLFPEAEELLRTEFHQEAPYASILRAVASGEERPSDIARTAGRHSAAEIFDHLRRLQELRFLRREVSITEWQSPRSHRVVYDWLTPTYASGSALFLLISRSSNWEKRRTCGRAKSDLHWTGSSGARRGKRSADNICGEYSGRIRSGLDSRSSAVGGMARMRSTSWVCGATE